jgi:VIT1/CCC1 family predicted Fe2+/Mn2+ transporter
MNWLSKLFGLGEIAGEYLKERQRLKNELKLKKLQGEIDLVAAKTQAAVRRQEMTHTWEMAQIANSGYKDEVVLGVLLIPYVGAFVPVVQDYILVGFQYLEQMPYWAVGLTVTIFLAIYGIRHRNASRIQAPGLRDGDVTNGTQSKPDGQS